MAMAPPRPCTACGRIRCEEHPTVAWRPRDGTPVKRIRGRELQRRRELLFARDRWCVMCAQEGRRTRATIRDHIVPLAEGGTEDASNEQALCLDCSDAKTEGESKRGVARSSMSDRFRKGATPRNETGQFNTRRPGWTR